MHKHTHMHIHNTEHHTSKGALNTTAPPKPVLSVSRVPHPQRSQTNPASESLCPLPVGAQALGPPHRDPVSAEPRGCPAHAPHRPPSLWAEEAEEEEEEERRGGRGSQRKKRVT